MRVNIAFSRPLGAVLVLLGILLLGLVGIAALWADLSAASDERDAKTGFVTRSLAAGRGKAPPGPDGAGDSGRTVEATTDTLAAAQVDALVRSIVVAAGGTVLSSRAEAKPDDPKTADAERIEGEAVIQGRIEALQASLFHLERGHPLVLIDSLVMRPVEADSGAGAPQAPVLTATLTLSAFWTPRKP